MAYYSGNSGKIEFAPSPDGPNDPLWKNDGLPVKVTQWTMNSTVQLLETTSLGDWDKTSEYGIRSHSGTLQLFYYSEEIQSSPLNNAASWFVGALTMAATQGGRQNLGAYEDSGDFLEGRSPVPVRLMLFLRSMSASAQDFLTFDSRLTSVSYASSVNEITSVDVAFEATGQIIVNNL